MAAAFATLRPLPLFDAGIKVAAQIPCEAAPNSHKLAHLRTKKAKMGHTVSLGQHQSMGWANHGHADDKDFDIRQIASDFPVETPS